MRIQNLKITNIASLKGEHWINFNEISEVSNVFAITGKTGSGKSSILNAISLALYGEVYKRGSTSADFITLGEKFGKVEINFSNKSNEYKAIWKLKLKKKNGDELKKPQLSRILYQITKTEEIALEYLPEKVIDLTFSEFCKTTILNQGEFSKFLNSKFNERKNILEKFYEGEELQVIGEKLKNKIKTFNLEINNIDHQILGLTQGSESIDISIESINKLKLLLGQYSKTLESSNQLHSSAKDLISLLDTFENHSQKDLFYTKQFSEINNHLNRVKKSFNESQIKFNKIEHELKSKKPILTEAIKKEAGIGHLKNELDRLNEKNIQYKKNTDLAHGTITKLNESLINLTNAQTKLAYSAPYLEIYSHAEILSKIDEIRSLNEKLEQIATQLNHSNKMLSEISSQEEKDLLLLNNVRLDKEKNQLGLKDKNTYNDHLKEVERIKIEIEHFFKEKKNIDSKTKSLSVAIEDSKEKIKYLNDQLNHQNLMRENLSLRKEKIQLITSHNVCLTKSLEDKECYICGSEKIEHLYKKADDKVESTIDLDDKIKENQNHVNHLNSQLTEKNLQLNLGQNEKRELELTLSKNEAHTLSLWNKISILPIVENHISPDLISIIKRKNEEMIEMINLLNNKEQNLRDLDQNEKHLLAQSSIRKQKQNNLANEVELINKQKTEIIFEIQHYADSFKIKSLNKESVLSISTNNNVFHSNKNEILLHENKIQGLNEQILINNDEQESNLLRIEHLKAEYAKTIEFIKINTQSSHPSNELKELENIFYTADSEVKQSLAIVKKIEIEIAELNSKKDQSREQMKQSIELIHSILKNIKDQSNNFKEIVIFEEYPFFATIKKIYFKFFDYHFLEENINSKILKESLNTFTTSIRELKDYVSTLQEEYTRNETLYNQKVSTQNEITSLNKKKKIINNELQNFLDLNILIGKDEFRNYILAMIETLLLDQTNKELETLCNNRYQIISPSGKSKINTEFEIIDFYHDGSVRKVSTLSGGETFLVSLAMAIALAELTRGNTQIDTLFIDEGFGTLDSEAIEEVYELLLNIQSTGKQVGIISHVKNLTEKLPVNLYLEKNFNGLSTIQKIFN